MSEQERDSRDACARYAPTLALLDEPGLSADARRAALEHLAGCARCQADQRAYARLDDGLRRAFGPVAASPLRTADLLAAIGATHEPTTPPRWAAQPTSDAIRSVVYLGDFDDLGGSNRMSETDETSTESGMESAESDTPARRLAAIPSLRPAPHERASRGRVWTLGFSAVAAVVVFVVVTTTLFASQAARSGVAQTAHNAATRTAMAQATAGAQPGAFNFNGVAMDSPSDGWAFGWPQAASGPEGALFYHYDGSQWTLKAQVQGFQPMGGNAPASLKLFSATDGWAFDGSSDVLHYDGAAWRQVSITLSGVGQVNGVIAFDMVSPTEGWAAANVSAPTGATIAFLRYDGQRWSLERSAISAPGLDLSYPYLSIYGFSATPNGDAWAVGSAFITMPVGQGTSKQSGLLFHRVNGVWRVVSELNHPGAAMELIPRSILMTGPTSGWIVGETEQSTSSANGVFVTTHALLLRYNGARWTPVASPIDTSTDGDSLNQIVANGPNDIWVHGTTAAAIVTSAGAQISALLLHYDGTTWSEVMPNVPVSAGYSVGVTSVALTPDDALWAVGAGGKMYGAQSGGNQDVSKPFVWLYRSGSWSVVPIAGVK